jgi:hypothetical protein
MIIISGYVPKEPFMSWFLKLRDSKKEDFGREISPRTRFRQGGWDATSFAEWCGLTHKEYHSLIRNAFPDRRYVKFEIVDRVLTAVGPYPWLLEEWYPSDPQTGELLSQACYDRAA